MHFPQKKQGSHQSSSLLNILSTRVRPNQNLFATNVSNSFIQLQKFTRFEQMLAHPELISFKDLRQNYHFGIHPLSTLHLVLCICLFGLILLFRFILWFFELLGYLFFNVLIRLIFECLIRGIFG